jgi:hypothetical protein
MAPPHFGGFGSTIRRGPAPDLAAQEATAIDELRGKKADVVVLSRATAHLILQLYRPDQNQWQEYQLAPLKPTSISCQPCNGKLRCACFLTQPPISGAGIRSSSFLPARPKSRLSHCSRSNSASIDVMPAKAGI